MDHGMGIRETADSSLPQHRLADDGKEFVGRSTSQPLLSPPHYGVEPMNQEHPNSHRKNTRRPGVVPIALFAAPISAIVIGAAVRGGLGSALAKAKAQPTRTTTVTIATTVTTSSTAATTTGGLLVNYTVAAPTDVASLSYNCPTDYTTVDGTTFLTSCTTNMNGGDLGASVAYTYQDGIEACESMNTLQKNASLCTGTLFWSPLANITAVTHHKFGNCFLKNANTTKEGVSESVGVLSAQLVES